MSEFTILGMSQLASLLSVLAVAIAISIIATLIIYNIVEHNKEKEAENEEEKDKTKDNPPEQEITLVKTFNNKDKDPEPDNPPKTETTPQQPVQPDNKALDEINKLNNKMDQQFENLQQKLSNLQDRQQQQQPQQQPQDNGPLFAILNSLKDMLGQVLDKVIPGNQNKTKGQDEQDTEDGQNKKTNKNKKESEHTKNEEQDQEEDVKTTTEASSQVNQDELQPNKNSQNNTTPVQDTQQQLKLVPVYQQNQQPQQQGMLSPIYQQQPIVQPLPSTTQRKINDQPIYQDQNGSFYYKNGQPVYTNKNIPDAYNPNYQAPNGVQLSQPGQNNNYPQNQLTNTPNAQYPQYQQYPTQQPQLQPLIDTRTGQQKINPNGTPLYYDTAKGTNVELYDNGQPAKDQNGNYIPYNPNQQNYTPYGQPYNPNQQNYGQPYGAQYPTQQPQLQPLIDAGTRQQKINPNGVPLYYDPVKGTNVELYDNGQPAKDQNGNYMPYNPNQQNYNPYNQPYNPNQQNYGQPPFLQQKQILESIIQKIPNPAKRSDILYKLNNQDLPFYEKSKIIDDIVNSLNDNNQTLLTKGDLSHLLGQVNDILLGINIELTDQENLTKKQTYLQDISLKLGSLNSHPTEPATSQDIKDIMEIQRKVASLRESAHQKQQKKQPHQIASEINSKIDGLTNIDANKLNNDGYLNQVIIQLVDDINRQELKNYADDLNNDIYNIVENANLDKTISYDKPTHTMKYALNGKTIEQKQEAIMTLANVKQAIGKEQKLIKDIAKSMGIPLNNEEGDEEDKNLSPKDIAEKIIEYTNNKLGEIQDNADNEQKVETIRQLFDKYFEDDNIKYIQKEEGDDIAIKKTNKEIKSSIDIIGLLKETHALLELLSKRLDPNGVGESANINIGELINTINGAAKEIPYFDDTNQGHKPNKDFLNQNKEDNYNVNGLLNRIYDHKTANSIMKNNQPNYKNIINDDGTVKQYNNNEKITPDQLLNILGDIHKLKLEFEKREKQKREYDVTIKNAEQILQDLNDKIANKMHIPNIDKNDLKNKIKNIIGDNNPFVETTEEPDNILLELPRDQNGHVTIPPQEINDVIPELIDIKSKIEKEVLGDQLPEESKGNGLNVLIEILNKEGKNSFSLTDDNTIKKENLADTTKKYFDNILAKINGDEKLKNKIIEIINDNNNNNPIFKVFANDNGDIKMKNLSISPDNDEQNETILKDIHDGVRKVADIKTQIQVKNKGAYNKVKNLLGKSLNMNNDVLNIQGHITAADILLKAKQIVQAFNDQNKDIFKNENIQKEPTDFLEFDNNDKTYKLKQSKEPKTNEDFEAFAIDVFELQKKLYKKQTDKLQDSLKDIDKKLAKDMLVKIKNSNNVNPDVKSAIPDIANQQLENIKFGDILNAILDKINQNPTCKGKIKSDDNDLLAILKNAGLKIQNNQIVKDDGNKKEPEESLIYMPEILMYLIKNKDLDKKLPPEILKSILTAQGLDSQGINGQNPKDDLKVAQQKIIEKLNKNYNKYAGLITEACKYIKNDDGIKEKKPTDSIHKFMEFYEEVKNFEKKVLDKLEKEKKTLSPDNIKELGMSVFDKLNKRIADLNERNPGKELNKYNATEPDGEKVVMENDLIKPLDTTKNPDNESFKRQIKNLARYIYSKKQYYDLKPDKAEKLSLAINSNDSREMAECLNECLKPKKVYQTLINKIIGSGVMDNVLSASLCGELYNKDLEPKIKNMDGLKKMAEAILGKFENKELGDGEKEIYDEIKKIYDSLPNENNDDLVPNFIKQIEKKCEDILGTSLLNLFNKQYNDKQSLIFGAACAKLLEREKTNSFEYVFHDSTNRIGNPKYLLGSKKENGKDIYYIEKPFNTQSSTKTITYKDDNGKIKIASAISLSFTQKFKNTNNAEQEEKYYIDIPIQYYEKAKHVKDKKVKLNCDEYNNNILKALDDPNTPVFIRKYPDNNASRITTLLNLYTDKINFYNHYKDSTDQNMQEQANKQKKEAEELRKYNDLSNPDIAAKKIVIGNNLTYNDKVKTNNKKVEKGEYLWEWACNNVHKTTIGNIYKMMFAYKTELKTYNMADTGIASMGFISLNEIQKEKLAEASAKIGRGG